MLKSCRLVVAIPLDFDEPESDRCLASAPDEDMAAVITLFAMALFPLRRAVSRNPACDERRFGSERAPLPRLSRTLRRWGKASHIHVPGGQESPGSRMSRKGPGTQAEATQVGPQASHGTRCCPLPDPSFLRGRCTSCARVQEYGAPCWPGGVQSLPCFARRVFRADGAGCGRLGEVWMERRGEMGHQVV